MIKVAVIGAGRWGKNHVRVADEHPGFKLEYICDPNPVEGVTNEELRWGHLLVDDYSPLLTDMELDAVVVATPAPTHYEIAKAFLLHGKHVLVEKPMCMSIDQAVDLNRVAEGVGKVLRVGHLMLHNPGITKIRNILRSGAIGHVRHMSFIRTNLGVVRRDENAWWSLAPHDISIANHFMGQSAMWVRATGDCYLQKGVEDTVWADMKYLGGVSARIQVSWYDAARFRRVAVVGTKGSLIYDDTHRVLQVSKRHIDLDTMLASGVEGVETEGFDGKQVEPLVSELDEFYESIKNGRLSGATDGNAGLAVVTALEAGQRSMDRGGDVTYLGECFNGKNV